MKKKVFLANRGGGKTPWILENMKKESENNNKKLYYLGGHKDYEKLCSKLASLGCNAKINLISKEIYPIDNNCAVFTDSLLYSMWYIWPAAVREIAKYDCTWYITMNAEDFDNIALQ